MEKFPAYVYESMNGYADEKQILPALHGIVQNEFAENSLCEKWCDLIYDARLRLANRLGTDEEDADILALVNAYESMSRYIAEKMYVYGEMNLQK